MESPHDGTIADEAIDEEELENRVHTVEDLPQQVTPRQELGTVRESGHRER